MRSNRFFYSLLGVSLVMLSCQRNTTTIPADAVVELNGKYLCQSQLTQITQGLSLEDSAQVAENYIKVWVENQLILDEVDKNIPELESQIEKYREELYINYYQEQLLNRMSSDVNDSVVQAEYEEHSQNYILEESLVKGLLLVVPKEEKVPSKIYSSVQKPTVDNLEKIEAFAYQYATGYELFLDRWITLRSIALHLPVNSDVLNNTLRSGKTQIRLEDSISTYIFQVTEKCMAGDKMPVEYAHDRIVEMALYERQQDIIRAERTRLYESAIDKEKVKYMYHDKK